MIEPDRLYTSSRLRVLRRCLAEHRYRYGLGLVQPASAEMSFGTAGHEVLETYYAAWQLDLDADARLDHALQTVDAVTDPIDRVKLRALLVGYHTRWGGEPWRVLEVEREFRYELGGYRIGGKIDAIVERLTDGRIFVVEHKTTGSSSAMAVGSPYWEKLSIDSQVSIYVDGAAILGYEVAGVIYDVLIRPEHAPLAATPEDKRKLTQGKGCRLCGGKLGVRGEGFVANVAAEICHACDGSGWQPGEEPRLYAGQRDQDESIEDYQVRVAAAIETNPDQFYRRGEVVRLADELPRMRLDLIQAIWLGEITEERGIFIRNTDACARYDSMCSYFPICSGSASADDVHRYPRGPIHAELIQGGVS